MSARVELTPRDVARIRIGPPLGPFGETVQALGHVGHRPGTGARRRWVTEVRTRLTPHDRALGSFLWLSPSVGFDFYTISEPTSTMEEGRQALLGLDRDDFVVEAEYWAHARGRARQLRVPTVVDGGPPVAPRGLRSGTVESRHRLFDDVARFHRKAVAPWWPRINDHLHEHRERWARRLGEGGVEAVWAELGDQVGWTGAALELPNVGVTGTELKHYRLDGRGLVVVPSFFAREPGLYFPEDPVAPVMLIAPCPTTRLDEPVRPPAGRSGELLGQTRTGVLEAVAVHPHTTTELGHALGIATSSASYHATVLRRAGLLRTMRDGVRVRHTVTALGRTLLGQLPRDRERDH